MVLKGISLDQLQDRDRLRASVDRFRRDADAGGKIGAIDEFTEQALGILASSRPAPAT